MPGDAITLIVRRRDADKEEGNSKGVLFCLADAPEGIIRTRGSCGMHRTVAGSLHFFAL